MSATITYPTTTLEVEIALGIGQQVNAGVWDSSGWDAAVWAQTDTTLGDWVDVTCDVLSVDVTAGASAADGVVTKIEATTGAIGLRGPQWNPWASPWRGVLGPAVPARGRWRHPSDPAGTWRPWFMARSDGWPYDAAAQRVAVPFIDATGRLGNYRPGKLAAPVGAGETVSARMNRVLTAARWPAAARDIPANAGPTTIPTVLDDDAWSLLSTAADTDLGIVWVTRAGLVAFRPVAQTGQWTPDPIPYRLVDDSAGRAADICVVNFTRSEPQVVRNDVTVAHAQLPVDSPPAVPAVNVTDDASIQRYDPHTYQRTDLIHDNDAWSATVAAVILQTGAWPALHPQTADLDIRADARVADLLLGAEITQTINALDTGVVFRCVVVGYTTHLTNRQLSGSLILQDVTAWIAGRWDTAAWDADRWGV